jgi:hypothetical protein
MELEVDNRNEMLERGLVALSPGDEQRRDIAGGRRFFWWHRAARVAVAAFYARYPRVTVLPRHFRLS